MTDHKQDVLEVLRFELQFLNDGGYGRSPHAPWRAPYIFEDSPTCLNFNDSSRSHPCGECLLTQLVPPELRREQVPCRFIPLNGAGQTVDSLYQYGTQLEMEDALRRWLRREIGRIEEERATEH
jgi:hypothetical protein